MSSPNDTALRAELRCSHCRQEIQPGEPIRRVSEQVEGVAGEVHRLYHEMCMRAIESHAPKELHGRVSRGEADHPLPALFLPQENRVVDGLIRISLEGGYEAYSQAVRNLSREDLDRVFANLPYFRKGLMINLTPLLERIAEVSSDSLGRALCSAAEKGNLILVDKVGDSKERISSGRLLEALLSACTMGNVDVVQHLLENKMVSETHRARALHQVNRQIGNAKLFRQEPCEAFVILARILEPSVCSIQ